MAGRPGRRRLDHTSPLVDLDAVFADDALIDSIAGRPFTPTDENPFTALRGPESPLAGRHRRDPIDELFSTWRQELAERPMPPVPARRQVAALVEQPREQPARVNRSMRSVLSVAAAIAALLIGSTTVGSKDATPDSPLWGITKVLWPDRAESVASRSSVREALDEAQSAIDAGNSTDAQLALLRATTELGNVDDVDGRDDMQQEVFRLWAQVSPGDVPSITQAGGSSAASTPPSSTTPTPTPTSPSTSSPAAQVAAALAAAFPSGPEQSSLPTVGGNAGAASDFSSDVPVETATPEASATLGPERPTDPTKTPESPSEDSSSDDPDSSAPASPPSTVPPPSVPIAPVTSVPATDSSAPQTAPAQSAPVPTPSSSSPGTEPEPTADSPAASPAAEPDDSAASGGRSGAS